MNIIFEGINGAGKTSIIKCLVKLMRKNKYDVHKIDEISNISPLNQVLEKMYHNDTFLRMKKGFNTVIAESLILAADYHFIKEYTSNLSGYKIFDRDIVTQVVYQKYFLSQVYGKNNTFFRNWKKCLEFDMKDIDLFIYVDISDELALKRTCKRDSVILNNDDKKIMEDLHKLQKQYSNIYCKKNNIPFVLIDGKKSISSNAKLIYDLITSQRIT